MFVLFVSPGLRAADVAAAHVRFEGEDERNDHLSQERIRAVAAELQRAYGLRVEAEDDDEGDGSPRGVDLEGQGGDPSPVARVDGWGVTVSSFREADAAGTERNVAKAITIARHAARLLDTVIYEPGRRRMLPPGTAEDTALAHEAGGTIWRAEAPEIGGTMRKARAALTLLALFPVVGYFVASRFLSGFPLFVVVLGGMLAAALLTRRWLLRERRAVAAPTADEAGHAIRPR